MSLTKYYDGCFHCITLARVVLNENYSSLSIATFRSRNKDQNQLFIETLALHGNALTDTSHDAFIAEVNNRGIALNDAGQATLLEGVSQADVFLVSRSRE